MAALFCARCTGVYVWLSGPGTVAHTQFYLGLLPPPTSLNLFASAISIQRENYNTLRESFLVAPDGRWADDCSRPEYNGEGSSKPISASRNAQTTFDPLSLDEQSPWKTWYAHLELRKVIMQDVDRTFPDIPYFTLERVRRSMVTMLFLFSVLNPDVGYRQVSFRHDSSRPELTIRACTSFWRYACSWSTGTH